MRRYLLCLLLAVAGVLAFGGASVAQEDAAEVFVMRIDGQIDGQTAEYVERVTSEAGEQGAEAVVIEIDTPGGALPATREIVQTETNARETPVITYVSPQGAGAVSAGAIVVMGSDLAAMAPQTSIGASTPVTFFGQEIPGPMGEKVTNDTVSLITGLATNHERNEEWAETAVREAASVNASEAEEMNIVEYVEPDLEAVLEAADGQTVEPKGITLQTAGASLVEKPKSFAERFGFSVWWIVIPSVLLVLGAASAVFAAIRTSRWRVSSGWESMIGEIGDVRRPVEKSGGMVFVHGELWSAVAEDPSYTPIETGTEVEVTGFRRTAVVVRPAR